MSSTAQPVEAPAKRPRRWWQWVLAYPALAIAILGAVPQYMNVLKGLSIGVSANEVHAAQQQNKLWQSNRECTPTLHKVATATGAQVSVGACPTGDIQIAIDFPNGESIVRWIAFESIESASSRTWFGAMREAVAAESEMSAARLAQSGTQIICQRTLQRGRVLRRVRRGSQCFDEIINTFTGRVEERRQAACDPSC